MLIHLSIPSKNSLPSLGWSLETLHLLWRSHRGLFKFSSRCHQWFLVVSLCRASVSLRSTLDLTVQIISRFHLSRYRDSWCQFSLTCLTLDPQCLSIDWNQRSRFDLDSTAAIWVTILHIEKSGFLLQCFFDISKTQSSKLRRGVHLLTSHMDWHVLNTATCHSDSWLTCAWNVDSVWHLSLLGCAMCS